MYSAAVLPPILKRGFGRLKTMVMVTRAVFATGVIVPAALGAVIAWTEGLFHGGYLLLTLLGVVSIHLGLNMSNDYFDHLSGNDDINLDLTPFSGGSRTIQTGVLTAQQVRRWSILFYLIGIVIGVYLAAVRGWPILGLGIIGVALAIFHNAPPIRLYSLGPGLGELAVGIGFGPLVVLGSYYVQAQRPSLEALWASIPIGLLITAVLYVNEFPDYHADRTVGRKTLPVVLGRGRAAWGYVGLLVGTYVVILLGAVLGKMSGTVLIALLTVPLAYRAIRGALRFHSNTARLVPTQAATIRLHLTTGLLLCLGCGMAGFVYS